MADALRLRVRRVIVGVQVSFRVRVADCCVAFYVHIFTNYDTILYDRMEDVCRYVDAL